MGFEKAKNEVLFILDADLTVPPEELPKFWKGSLTISKTKTSFVAAVKKNTKNDESWYAKGTYEDQKEVIPEDILIKYKHLKISNEIYKCMDKDNYFLANDKNRSTSLKNFSHFKRQLWIPLRRTANASKSFFPVFSE